MKNSRSEPAEEVGDSRRFRNTAPHAKSEPPLTTPLGPLPEVTSTHPLPRGLTSLVPDARTRATPGRARRPQLPHPHEATVPAPVLAAAAELITPGSRTLTRRPGKRPPPSAPGCSPRSTAPPWDGSRQGVPAPPLARLTAASAEQPEQGRTVLNISGSQGQAVRRASRTVGRFQAACRWWGPRCGAVGAADLDRRARPLSGLIPPESVAQTLERGHEHEVALQAGRGEWFCAWARARLPAERGRRTGRGRPRPLRARPEAPARTLELLPQPPRGAGRTRRSASTARRTPLGIRQSRSRHATRPTGPRSAHASEPRKSVTTEHGP